MRRLLLAGADEEDAAAAAATEWVDDGSLPVDGGGALPFFFLDAHEEPATPDRLFLFGKVRPLKPEQYHVQCIHTPNLTCLMQTRARSGPSRRHKYPEHSPELLPNHGPSKRLQIVMVSTSLTSCTRSLKTCPCCN